MAAGRDGCTGKVNADLAFTLDLAVDDGNGNILLSKKEANHLLSWERLTELLDTEAYVDVRVAENVKGGCVAYLEGIRGFIPASKLDLSYVEEADLPNYINKTLKVRVITADKENEKLVLSAREYLKECGKNIKFLAGNNLLRYLFALRRIISLLASSLKYLE